MRKPPDAVPSRAGAFSTSIDGSSVAAIVIVGSTSPAQDAFRPLAIFAERAMARAILVDNGHLDLIDAVDGLQCDAEAHGLVRRFGQDHVQWIMGRAFATGTSSCIS